MLALAGLRRAERFVTDQQEAGNDVRWDGWTMVFHKPHPQAATKVEGRFHGSWGFETRVAPDSDGVWRVDYRNVRRIPRTRSR